MRVLLVNPPARRTVLRDYLCSKTTKADYVYHPIDLLVLSGILASAHDVHVLDCIAERSSPRAAYAKIRRSGAELVVGLVAAVTWGEDRAFYKELARKGLRIVVTGDVLHEDAALRLEQEPWIEAALGDFTSDEILRFLGGDSGPFETLTVRRAGTVVAARPARQGAKRNPLRFPRPRHELFPSRGYRFPFARRMPFATILSDFGCPYGCTFCVMSTLDFRERALEDVLEEIDECRTRGVHEFFFLDQTFGVDTRRGLELCGQLERRGSLGWTAFLRPDRAPDELLAAMASAGCHTVILGAESARDEVLTHYGKGYGTASVHDAFARAHAFGLRTVGTFLIGLPEDDEESIEESLRWALELELDFLSVNVAVPRFGTPFRKEVLALGLASKDDLEMDQAGDETVLPTATLDRRAMLRLKRRLVRRFYLRPGYIAGRMRAAAGARELFAQARSALALLARNARL